MPRRFGPYSRGAALAKLDGRTLEGRLARDVRADLIKHVGAAPSTTQIMLIDSIVQLQLRIAAMDRKFAESAATSEHDTRTYLAWAAALRRALRELGLKGAPQRPPSLKDIIREPASESAAA